MYRPPRTGQKKSQRVDELIKRRDTPLAGVLQHAGELDRLDRQLSSLLDPQLAQSCQVAELRDGCLTLITPGATWATRLRMQATDIARKLSQANSIDIHHVVVRIAPVRRQNLDKRRKKGLPPVALQALQRFAEDSGDPEILGIVHGLEHDRDGE
jgi:hypothetical protein